METRDKNIEFLRAIRLFQYLENLFLSWNRPFLENSLIMFFLTKFSGSFAGALENLIGEKIYIKKTPSIIEHIPSRFHGLLEKLASAGVMENILYPQALPGWPQIPAINIKIKGMSKASGYALDFDIAATKAIAECIEWYSLTVCDTELLVEGSFAELKAYGALPPHLFSPFSENQLNQQDYAENRFDENTRFFWARCRSYPDGKNHLIPAQFIYIGQSFGNNEPKIIQPSSNGSAAGSSWEMAMAHALLETAERDAFLIHWLNKISPPQIDLHQFSDKRIHQLFEKYKKYSVDFAVFDITADIGIPVILTAVRESAPNRQKLYVSTRSDLDITSAIVASLTDGLRAGFWPDARKDDITKAGQKAPLVENIEERRAFWSDKARAADIEFLFKNKERKKIKNNYAGATDKMKLRKIKEFFLTHNFKIYYADVTTPIARDAGLFVTKTIVPGLCPMYLNEHFKCLGIRRLYETPVRMGILGKSRNEKEMNLVPHPFL